MSQQPKQTTTLKRVLGLPQLLLYGLGTTIGAGIYALIGELAAVSGYYSVASFLVAATIAFITALSFAEISARIPKAAGSASYVFHGFNSKSLSTAVGILVIMAGLTSTSALVNAFYHYLDFFIVVERLPTLILVMLCIGLLAAWGIAQSVTVAALITIIEVFGLLLVIWVSVPELIAIKPDWSLLIPNDIMAWGLVYAGALLAFYTFIGFEDMVVVAEETRDVKRTLPNAIILTLTITSILYIMIMIAAIYLMTPEGLSQSSAPLAELYAQQTNSNNNIILFIGMISILNGALIQVIMAARVLYGLASNRQLPQFLAYISPKTQTPVTATMLASAIALIMAISGSLAGLAQITSIVMLVVFALVNGALLRIKLQNPKPEGILIVPTVIPILGLIFSLFFCINELLAFI